MSHLYKKTSLLLVALLFQHIVICQTVLWSHGFPDAYVTRGAVDPSGNTYSTGYFSHNDNPDFDPGAVSVHLQNSGEADIFIQKLNADGNFAWAKSIGGPGSDRGNSIAVDKGGNSYIIGDFSGKVDFDPGADSFFLNAGSMMNARFLMKLDGAGNFIWAKKLGYTHGNSIALSENHIYITGDFSEAVDFDPDTGTYFLQTKSPGSIDAFVLNLTLSGGFVWAVQLGNQLSSNITGVSVGVDHAGNVYSAGFLSHPGDFDPGPDTLILSPFGSTDVYVQKLSESGGLVWARSIGSDTPNANTYAFDMAVDESGYVYLTGNFNSPTDFDPGPDVFYVPRTAKENEKMFLLKLDTYGNFVWAEGAGNSGFSLALDNAGNVYTIGTFADTVDFDPGAGEFFLIADSLGGFVQKLDADGNFQWVTGIKGTGVDIKLDMTNNIYAFSKLEQLIITKIGYPTTGVISTAQQVDFKTFPNPTSGDIILEMDRTYPKVRVQVIAESGQIISTQYFEQAKMANVQIAGDKGNYLLNVQTSKDKQVSMRVLKQ